MIEAVCKICQGHEGDATYHGYEDEDGILCEHCLGEEYKRLKDVVKTIAEFRLEGIEKERANRGHEPYGKPAPPRPKG